jgi:hypothetical protein
MNNVQRTVLLVEKCKAPTMKGAAHRTIYFFIERCAAPCGTNTEYFSTKRAVRCTFYVIEYTR